MHSLIYYPDERLRTPCSPVTVFDQKLEQLAQDMYAIMVANDGIGLAAPQIGEMVRLIIVREETAARPFSVYVNPVITFYSEKKVSTEEGCLSIPGVFGYISRSAKIRIAYQDLTGEKRQEKANGLRAIVLQHETDHVNGILILDRQIQITKQPHD